MTLIVLKESSHATLRSQAYAYDKANFILEHTVGSNTTEYTYDAAGQLIREEKPWLSYDREYEYDGNGNRTLHTGPGGRGDIPPPSGKVPTPSTRRSHGVRRVLAAFAQTDSSVAITQGLPRRVAGKKAVTSPSTPHPPFGVRRVLAFLVTPTTAGI